MVGEVMKGELQLSDTGEIVRQCWEEMQKHFNNAILDEYINAGWKAVMRPLRSSFTKRESGSLPKASSGLARPSEGHFYLLSVLHDQQLLTVYIIAHTHLYKVQAWRQVL
jgi:hypothetical protein